MMKRIGAAALLCVGMLAACQPAGPLRTIGVYRISVAAGDNELWWAQWGDTLAAVVLDVQVEQTSERNENAYGVMCRVQGTVGQDRPIDPELAAIADDESTPEADPANATTAPDTEVTETPTDEVTPDAVDEATPTANVEPSFGDGDGYLFLIQGGGSYGIFRSRGRSLTPLVDWAQSDAITIGPGLNRLRAVCAGDYLALYVNDRLLAEAIDTTYSEGQVGLVASAANRLGVEVEFDNLIVSAPQSAQ